MQAYRAYYDDGKFVTFEPVTMPKGSQAIVTILDFPLDEISDTSRRQLDTLKRFRKGVQNCNEPVPAFERVTLREVEI